MVPRPVKITLNPTANCTKTYDGTTDAPSGFTDDLNLVYANDVTKVGILEADKNDAIITYSAQYDSKDVKGTNGSKIIVTGGLSGSKAGNYHLVFENSDNKIEFPGTITQKSKIITLQKYYDGNKNFSTDNLVDKEFDGVNNEKIVISSIADAEIDAQDANVTADRSLKSGYAITYSNDVHKNYDISFFASILPKPLTISLTGPFTYGASKFGDDIVPTITDNIAGTFKAKNQSTNQEYTFENTPMLPAGTYTLSFGVSDNPGNYNVENNNSSFKVNPIELDVNLAFQKTYDKNTSVGDDDWSPKTLTNADNTNILSGDVVKIYFDNSKIFFASENVHTATTVSIPSDIDFKFLNENNTSLNGNYVLKNLTATSTITARELTYTDFYFEKYYDGNSIASGYCITPQNQLTISQVSAIVGEDVVGFEFTNPAFESANATPSSTPYYTVSFENLTSTNPNYVFKNCAATGKILKRELEISLEENNVTYGESKFVSDIHPTVNLKVATPAVTIPGNFVATDKTTNVTYSYDTNNDVMLPAGEYEISYELLADDKVNFTEPETKQVTVTKRETSINLSYAKDKIYDATTTVLDFNGVINNLIVADKNLINVSAEYEDKNVGDNRIDFTISALESFKQNYACENAKIYNSNNVEIGHLDANCSFQFNNAADCIGKISQCEITINSTQNITKPYDGTTDVENFTVTGFSVAGNDNSVTFSPTTDYSLPEIEGEIYSGEKIKITPKAEYNNKNVSEANKITISGTVDNDNYKVVPRQIEPATITPSVVTVTQTEKPTKTYDGDNTVKNFSESNYIVEGIYNDDVQFGYEGVVYDDVNAGTDIKLNFTTPKLTPTNNNYSLSVGEFKGDIKKIKPTIKWYIGDQEQTDPVRMSYGKLVGTNGDLYAMIYEATYREQYLSENCLYEVTSGYASGQNTENRLLFTPGNGRAKVTFRPTDAVNYETVSSEINLEITFAWQFEHEVNSNYGSSIGNEIKFYYSGIGLSESDLEYTYFLDGKEVPKGYIPKVGPHKLYCQVKHATLGNTQTEEINFTIEPRVLILSKYDWVEEEGNKLRRPYDGTTTVYDEQIKELAEIDKDLIISGDEVFFNTDMAYDDEEVGDRLVNVKYSLTGKDSYCYVFDINKMQEYSEAIPGFIKRCPAFVGFKEYDKVYGSSELGKDIVPTTTYVRYKGEKISPEGTCVFEVLHDGNELREYESGKMMNVGVYYMRVKFTPEDQLHYEDGRSNFEYVKVTQKSISATGVTIEDKYYDGTAKVSPVKVKLFDPELDGVIEQDKNNVKLEITNLQDIKYPDVKIGDYQGLVVKVALKGSGIENYKLTNSELKANSSILPFEFHYNVEPDETGVYQFVYGSSVMGKDFKLINELTETQTVRYKISNIDKTNQMLVPNTYKVDVQLYDSDMLVQSQQVTVNVVKLKLLTTVPNIAHAKLHDGTVSVKLIGERCVLTNVVEGDQVEIEKQEQFYDSPDLGTGKTITVSFTLSGAWHSKYIEPDNYVYNDGVITNKNIQIGSVGISGDICPSSNAPIVFDVVEGIPDKASIKFSAEALENGFEDITITNTQFGLNSVELKIPEKAKAGEYTATLYLSSGSDNNFEKVFMFTVNYDASYIISKFSDVVAINNAGYDFVGYQWYKDGHVIETETKQFFNDLPCLYGWYSAKVLTVDGTYANICPRYFDKRTAVSKRANAGVNVYPNPALPMQAVTVELEDFEDYENCTIFIYNLSGVLITKIQNPDRLNTLNLPQGSYTGVVVKDDSRLTFKLIVRK
ncbi:MAG: YDG domain-containing protein [Bacteroidales bacterium]|nr:YDG domain-containing protein [Bacteroidales bacterium]